ncbi:fungal-specific transcription factor domain-containing protein [Halenospora varia]|nr:fungal-specific transcription factor domain-containing protein [Halenospora varia]
MSSLVSGTSPAPVPPPPKQIRFVNNEGQPPAKRRRINAACRTCRKRKTRCDGQKPVCLTCSQNGHECLGYADGVESNTKKDRKNSDATRQADEDNDEDDDRSAESGGHIENGQHTFAHSNRNPDQRREEPYKSQASYRDSVSGVRGDNSRDMTGSEKGSMVNFGNDYRESAIYSDDGPSPPTDQSPLLHSESHRVPYFRYFGPTAIVPGFKQMVVSVREHRRSTGAGSAVAMSPSSGGYGGSIAGGTPSVSGTDPKNSVEMPIYDRDDPLPVNRLIIHLVETFFAHLGCNYPFLRQKSFIQRVEERSAEAILVDAVCALAARFSDHPLLVGSHDSSYPKSDYGNAFAHRAKAALVDHFPCPTVAATQACLLLAYEGFGANQDSALWMYLGCAIRMVVDLGLQKLDGVKHQGQKDPESHRMSIDSGPTETPAAISAQERKEVEQERIDTLWAVFMLDRVISSGTGRPVTLRDEDFELAFPAVTANSESGWPNPFPALIQIIHLYGRVSDLLNNIRNVQDVTPKKIEGLAGMEKDLTHLYQRLDQRLNFNAANFQHYCKSGEGTNFILVHFWFHTLIMLLHQPTLMHSFEGQIVQLLPNSRELSMSSAKTIADILAFAELIDPRSFIGNPFTSQPMYIAACAFLKESAAHTSQPTSRDATPPHNVKATDSRDSRTNSSKARDQQKHSLLASNANQNYQRCYKALQQLETYWGGTRYILVALDQKAKGIWDPETYTQQEYESTKIRHDMIPSWRKKLRQSASSPGRIGDLLSPRMDHAPGSPAIDPSQAIGWSLTGTTNSPSSNLTFMYQSMNGEPSQTQPQLHQSQPPPAAGNMIYDPIRGSLPESTAGTTATTSYPPRYPNYNVQPRRQHSQPMPPPAPPKFSSISSDPATTSEAEMLLGLQNSPYAHTPGSHHSYDPSQAMASPTATRQDPSHSSFDFQNGGSMFPDVLNFFDNGNTPSMPGTGSLNGGVDLNSMPTSGS